MTVVVGCVLIVYAAASWLESWLDERFPEITVEELQRFLPAEVRAAAILKRSSVAGLIEGCGVTVLQLDRSVTEAIRRGGLGYLNAHTSDRTDSRFEPWRAAKPGDKWAVYETSSRGVTGLNEKCSPELSADERLRFRAFLETPGAFWTVGREMLLIIQPDSNVMVLSGNG